MFNFDLPKARIPNKPSENREDAKLMVVHKSTGEIEHRNVSDLGEYFDDKDVIVINNTKVFPARLYANKEKTLKRLELKLANLGDGVTLMVTHQVVISAVTGKSVQSGELVAFNTKSMVYQNVVWE